MRQTDMRKLVMHADPLWVRDSSIVEEYYFGDDGDPRKSHRSFKAAYRQRGAYNETISVESALLNWGDQGNGYVLNWGDQGDGIVLNWGDEA